MPVIPSTNPNGEEPAHVTLNATRLRLHQKMPTLIPYSGIILRETEPSTQQAYNSAYRKLQAVMANAGSSTFDASTVIVGIRPVSQGALDPSTECWISKAGCNDGLNYYTTPALPGDLMTPYWISERWSGAMLPFPGPRRPNMACCPDGLPHQRKGNYNGCWEWRGEVIYYPGSFQAEDFLLRYQRYLPDVDDVGTTPWFEQGVPIMRSGEAHSYWICREFCMSASNDDTLDPDVRAQYLAAVAGFETMALAATRLLVSPDKKRKQRINVTRIPYGRGGGGGGFGGGTCGPAYTGG